MVANSVEVVQAVNVVAWQGMRENTTMKDTGMASNDLVRPAETVERLGSAKLTDTPEDVIIWALEQRTFDRTPVEQKAAAIMRELAFNRYVVVELPPSEGIDAGYNDNPDVTCLGAWAADGALTAWSDGLITDGNGAEFSPAEARRFAAALLAAAAAIEKQTAAMNTPGVTK